MEPSAVPERSLKTVTPLWEKCTSVPCGYQEGFNIVPICAKWYFKYFIYLFLQLHYILTSFFLVPPQIHFSANPPCVFLFVLYAGLVNTLTTCAFLLQYTTNPMTDINSGVSSILNLTKGHFFLQRKHLIEQQIIHC